MFNLRRTLRDVIRSAEERADDDAFDALIEGGVVDHGRLVGTIVVTEQPKRVSPWVARALANDLPAGDLTGHTASVL